MCRRYCRKRIWLKTERMGYVGGGKRGITGLDWRRASSIVFLDVVKETPVRNQH